jgi:hypothetical protein
LGIALVTGLRAQTASATLHERVMRRYFGRTTVYLVRRTGVHQHETVSAFAAAVRSQLARGQAKARGAGS